MSRGQWIAIDWDHSLFDTPNLVPMAGARDALSDLHEAGHKIIVHSCNNPGWIRKMCEEHDLRVDAIWGETGLEGAKPVCAVYIDDRAVGFRGDWADAVRQALAMIEGRPMSGQ